jgi:ABC-type nitrate/sulfonate/bicarbonate transport system substrate-binding protein
MQHTSDCKPVRVVGSPMAVTMRLRRGHAGLRGSASRGRCLLQAVLWALALGLGPSSSMAQDLTIAVSRTSLSLPLYVAESQKFFADEGLSVQTRECIGGQRCIKLMFDGQVHLATASELPVMFNSFTRSDYAIVATFVTAAQDVKLVARKSAGIASAAQLAAKRIGTVKGTSAHYFLDTFLVFNGVDPKKVEVVPLAPEQIEQAIKDRKIDAAAIWEPYAHKSLKALAEDGAVLPSGRIYTESFNLIAGRRVLAEREADIVKLLRAVDRAERWIRERPAEAQAILKDRLQEDQAFIDATWKDFNYRLSLDQSLISTIEGEARWALREGHVPSESKTPNYLQFIEAGPLRKAVPGAVTLFK